MATPYDKSFFDQIEDGSLESARLIVQAMTKTIALPKSVIDVGCGRGAWLSAFQECGAETMTGVDGSYVDVSRLLVPRESFLPIELNRPFELSGNYDLAVSLEVGEHLPAAMAPILVRELTRAAPIVLFSAAIPGQGGRHHVNEQLPGYWRELFEARGFSMFDPIRPFIHFDERVQWWYRQNILIYASREVVERTPALASHRVPAEAPGIEWVHARMVIRPTLWQISKLVGPAARNTLGSRLGKFFGSQAA